MVIDSVGHYLLDYVCYDFPELLYPYAFEGPYERGKVILEPDDVVIDAGSAIGDFSALACVKGCAKVYAFEPFPFTIASSLSKTADYYGNIEICQYALFDTNGSLEFLTENAMCTTKKAPSASNTIEVETITLDDFVKNNNITRVDFIKADIEGAERNMLAGAQWVLKTFAPKLAICTYHLPDDPKVLEELILKANPNYTIIHSYHKLHAYDKRRKRVGEQVSFE